MVFTGNARELQHAVMANKVDDGIQTLAGLHIGKHERPFATHFLRGAIHDLQLCTHMGPEVDLVDDQQIGLGDTRPALAGDLVARGHIDDI